MSYRDRRRLTLQQTAHRLGVHEQTIRRWMRKGLLRSMVTPAVSKFGQRHRFLESEVEKFAQRHLRGPARIEAPRVEALPLKPPSSSESGNGEDRTEPVQEKSQDASDADNLY